MIKEFIHHKKQKTGHKGFTLVELIVVLVILAILAAILVPALLGYIDKSRDQEYIVIAESVERAVQSTYAEVYAEDGYEILQCRSNFRTNGTHYNEKLYYYAKGKTNDAVWCDDESARQEVINTIVSLSDLGDYQFVYLSFAYDHAKHQLCTNDQKIGVAGQGAITQIKIKKKGSTDVVAINFDETTNTWQAQ